MRENAAMNIQRAPHTLRRHSQPASRAEYASINTSTLTMQQQHNKTRRDETRVRRRNTKETRRDPPSMHAFGPAPLLPSTHERVHQPSSRRAAAACFAGSRLVALEVARLVVRSDSGTAVQDWAAQCTIAPHEQTNVRTGQSKKELAIQGPIQRSNSLP